MKRIEPFEGQFFNEDDLKFIGESSLDAITQRFTTFYNLPGVVSGLVVRAGTQNDSIIISPGVGYNSLGEEIIVDTTITEFLTNFSIVPNATEYWVKIDFEQIETTPRFHPDTGLGPNQDRVTPYYTRLDNNYVLFVDNVAPTDGDTSIPLARITNHVIGNPINGINIDLTVVPTCNLKRELVEKLDHTTDLENVGTLTHAQIDTKISELESTTGVLEGQITGLTNAQLGYYISSRIQAHETENKNERLTFNLTRGVTNNTLSWNAGRIVTVENTTGYPVVAGSIALTGVNERGYIVAELDNSGSTITVESTPTITPGSNKMILGYCGDNDRLKYWYGSQSPVIIQEASATPKELYLTWNSVCAYGFNGVPAILEINNSNTSGYSPANIVSIGGTGGSLIWLGKQYTSASIRPRIRTSQDSGGRVITTITNKSVHDIEAPGDTANSLTNNTINIGVNCTNPNDRDERIAITGKEIYVRGPVYVPDNQFNQSPVTAVDYNTLNDFIYQSFAHDKFQLVPLDPAQPMFIFNVSGSSQVTCTTPSLRLASMPLLLNIVVNSTTNQPLVTDTLLYVDWNPKFPAANLSIEVNTAETVASKSDFSKVFSDPGTIRIPIVRNYAAALNGLITMNIPGQFKMIYPYFDNPIGLEYEIWIFPNKLEIQNVTATPGPAPSASFIYDKVLKIT